VAFPPPAITLLAFKDSKRLELYAPDPQGAWQQVRVYPIQAASGITGPKLREGDKQVPEGIYAIESLNPNSLFHVSLRLNYPNAFDQQMGLADGRAALGGDIMIHGKAKSIGCLAMGDVVAEEVFALAAWVGKENVRVVIAPTDFRQATAANVPAVPLPVWAEVLYQHLRVELTYYSLG
jgi:murein L,D-transpeptidase YafK